MATTSARLARRPWRRTAWSGESGFEDRDRRAAGGVLTVGRLVGRGPGERPRAGVGDTSAWLTTSVSPAPTSVSRIASRSSSGLGRHGGGGVSGSVGGIASIAVDAGDLLDDVRLDGEVAAPGRDRGDERRPGLGRDLDRLRALRPRRRASPAGAGRVVDARPGEDRGLPGGIEVEARAAGRPGPGGRRPRARRARPARCRSGRRSASRRPTRATSRAQRSAPIRASRTSWPFSNRRLASERSA